MSQQAEGDDRGQESTQGTTVPPSSALTLSEKVS